MDDAETTFSGSAFLVAVTGKAWLYRCFIAWKLYTVVVLLYSEIRASARLILCVRNVYRNYNMIRLKCR